MRILPPNLDLFAVIILLGVAQGLFLGLFFLTGNRGRMVANRCLGWFNLALSAISVEIFLNYTNYTFQVLWTVDLAEPFNFVLGPLFYCYVFSRIYQRLPRRWGWHLLPFAIWLVNAVTWIYQPPEFKYNSYIDSWHPEIMYVPSGSYLDEDFTGIRHLINELTLVSCVIYAVMALLTIRRAGKSVATQTAARLPMLRYLSWLFALVPVLIVVVKPQFYNDLGDHLLASYIALTIYVTSFLVMRGSSFFQSEPPAKEAEAVGESRKKYEKSSISEEMEEAVLQKLNRLMADEKPYLQSDLSLPRLAAQLNTTPHLLSQLLNDRLRQSFFDMMADYRIREAQALLRDPATAHLKIDEIAERVGYNSTSAFHTAFKRISGQTPAQFRAAATSSRSA